ncbi:MAG TPA: ABC transporter permease [Gemmataceae bacterium]|jgi:ribose/xylose/arabinose/galactoside ABC-type transport system permease subunit|nr:ABC transporter permease [Gemmataceae bacterium]
MNRLAVGTLRRIPWLIAAVILAVTVIAVPAFRQFDYWLDISEQYFAAAALALALMPIVLTGGIDLSVGSVTVFASVVIGALGQQAHWPVELAVAGGILAGLLAGLVNSSLVMIGIMPLVATLATRELFRGLASTLVGESTRFRFAHGLHDLWEQPVAAVPLPLPVYAIGFLFVLTYLVVHHTWIGRMVYAIGDNEQAARFAGLPVLRIKLLLYAWCGFVAGLCGAALVVRHGAAKADAEQSLELIAIACVVLGGVRITGGSGSVAGTLLGIVTVSVLLAGLTMVAATWRESLTGALLIVVAVINEASNRWAERRAVEAA